ncbi:hypothetical protein U0070_002646 [Myodes glareolus]|uniref:Uncharacterized protein n=1 Tax=Myodes glareolus TaxID=447135 RepID=A0AAW0IYW6_MYOGA
MCVQEGEYPNRLDPQNPEYAEETGPSIIVNGFSERLRTSHSQRIRPNFENLLESCSRASGRTRVRQEQNSTKPQAELKTVTEGIMASEEESNDCKSRKVSVQTDWIPKIQYMQRKQVPVSLSIAFQKDYGPATFREFGHIQRIWLDRILVQSQSNWPWSRKTMGGSVWCSNVGLHLYRPPSSDEGLKTLFFPPMSLEMIRKLQELLLMGRKYIPRICLTAFDDLRSIKVSIQTDQDPKKPGHADETRPSAIVNGFSVSPHVVWYRTKDAMIQLTNTFRNKAGYKIVPRYRLASKNHAGHKILLQKSFMSLGS